MRASLGQMRGKEKYDRSMARGWESKSVEDQISEHEGTKVNTAKGNLVEESAKKREKQALELQRERVLSERTSSPVRRAALEAALADIESRLESFK
jgi:hypothetical protein